VSRISNSMCKPDRRDLAIVGAPVVDPLRRRGRYRLASSSITATHSAGWNDAHGQGRCRLHHSGSPGWWCHTGHWCPRRRRSQRSAPGRLGRRCTRGPHRGRHSHGHHTLRRGALARPSSPRSTASLGCHVEERAGRRADPTISTGTQAGPVGAGLGQRACTKPNSYMCRFLWET